MERVQFDHDPSEEIMPRIVQTYLYPPNTTLDTAAHNENIMGEPGEGLMGTINGKLDVDNFSEKFRIQPEHVMPEQAARGRQEWDQYSTTIYSDGVAARDFDSSDEDTYRFKIPGCTIRFYQPYAARFALLQWSFFMGATKWRVERLGGLGAIRPAMNFVAYFDNAKLTHTRRVFPRTHQLDSSTTSPNAALRINNEAHSALWYDMSHLVTPLSAGWHELSIQLCMENVLDGDGDSLQEELKQQFGKVYREFDYYLFQKATFGVRNARVLTML